MTRSTRQILLGVRTTGIRGQGVNAFGAGWDALSPNGARIEGG
jgi:hypothetical protein